MTDRFLGWFSVLVFLLIMGVAWVSFEAGRLSMVLEGVPYPEVRVEGQ